MKIIKDVLSPNSVKLKFDIDTVRYEFTIIKNLNDNFIEFELKYDIDYEIIEPDKSISKGIIQYSIDMKKYKISIDSLKEDIEREAKNIINPNRKLLYKLCFTYCFMNNIKTIILDLKSIGYLVHLSESIYDGLRLLASLLFEDMYNDFF